MSFLPANPTPLPSRDHLSRHLRCDFLPKNHIRQTISPRPSRTFSRLYHLAKSPCTKFSNPRTLAWEYPGSKINSDLCGMAGGRGVGITLIPAYWLDISVLAVWGRCLLLDAHKSSTGRDGIFANWGVI